MTINEQIKMVRSHPMVFPKGLDTDSEAVLAFDREKELVLESERFRTAAEEFWKLSTTTKGEGREKMEQAYRSALDALNELNSTWCETYAPKE